MEYLLKTSAIIFIFYICYKVFLHRETFFQSNRWFILTGLIAAFCIPLIVIPIYVTKVASTDFGFTFSESAQINTVSEVSAYSMETIAMAIYMIGLIFFGLKFLIQLGSLIWLILKSERMRSGQYLFVKTSDAVSPFSFFNIIVFNPDHFKEEDLDQIIAHEKVHVSQMHSLDILLAQLALIVNWFNPFMWLYKDQLEQNLEFIADCEAQKASPCQKSYQHLLLKSSMPNYKMALANNFYNSLIKKRIVMLHKNRSNNKNQLKIAIVLPLLAVFLMSFNTKEVVTYEVPDQQMNTGLTAIPAISEKTELPLKAEGEVEIIMITKDMTDAELDEITEYMKKKGVTLKFKGVKRNKNKEIMAIEITAKTKSSNANYGTNNDEAINPIKIVITDNKSISISDGHDTGHRDYYFESDDDGTHKMHTGKKGTNVFVHKSSHDDDDEHEDHEIIKKDGKVIIKSGKNTKVITKDKGASIWISDDDDDDVEVIEIDEGDGERIIIKDDKKIVVKKDKDGKIVKEWIEKDGGGSNIWISGDDGDDEESIFTLKGKGKNKLFFSDGDSAKSLFILNGKEVSKDKIDALDSDQIESVNILKGKSALKKYGDKAENGVIEIKTRDQD